MRAHRRRRLVEHQDFALAQHGACEADELALPDREVLA
jgi:hypothetical protein